MGVASQIWWGLFFVLPLCKDFFIRVDLGEMPNLAKKEDWPPLFGVVDLCIAILLYVCFAQDEQKGTRRVLGLLAWVQ